MKLPGLGITPVMAGLDAESRGLRIGYRVRKIGGRAIATLNDVNRAVEQARALKRDFIMMQVVNSFGVRAMIALKLAN